MINCEDDNNSSMYGKNKCTHDSKTTQQHTSHSITNTNSRGLTRLLNPYSSNNKRLYNNTNIESNENRAINKNNHSSLFQEGKIPYIILNTSSDLSHNQKEVTASIILYLKDNITELGREKYRFIKKLLYQRKEIIKIISWLQSEIFWYQPQFIDKKETRWIITSI